MSKHRWVCQNCGKAKLGTSRPGRNATIRFCLPCSAKASVMVERTCPVLDRARSERSHRSAAKRSRVSATRKARKTRERRRAQSEAEAKFRYGGYDLRDELTRLLGFARSWGHKVRKPELSVRWRHSGNYCTGHSYGGRITLTIPKGSLAAPALAVLAHEVAHESVPRYVWHGDEWRGCFRWLVISAYKAMIKGDHSRSQDLHSAVIAAIAIETGEDVR